MSKIPAWFQRAVADGISALVVLELPARPYSNEDVRRAREVWCQVLWCKAVTWDERLDAPRLHQAFLRLAGSVTRWPAPVQLMEFLPARPEPPALPLPPMSKAQREHNSRLLWAGLRAALGGKND